MGTSSDWDCQVTSTPLSASHHPAKYKASGGKGGNPKGPVAFRVQSVICHINSGSFSEWDGLPPTSPEASKWIRPFPGPTQT